MKDNKAVRWNKIKTKIRIRQGFERAKQAAKDAGRWIINHPAESLSALAGVGVIVKKTSSAYTAHREKVRRETDFYDPRTGIHSHTRRPLKPAEKVAAERRHADGEGYAEIFYDMNLLRH